MPTVLRSTLVTRVRQRADQEASEFVTDDELDDMIEQSTRGLYDILIRFQGAERFLNTYNFNTVPGTSLYTLPSDLYMLSGVLVKNGSSWRALEAFQQNELAGLLNSTTSGSAASLAYRLRGALATPAQLELLPVPSVGLDVRVEYIPDAPKGGSEELRYYDLGGWEEWVVLDVAVKVLAKEESDTRALTAEREKLEARIASVAGSRDRARPDRMVDVRGCESEDEYGVPRWWGD